MDQRNCIKFCVENEIKCARTFEMLTVAFGDIQGPPSVRVNKIAMKSFSKNLSLGVDFKL